jgi:hypothetical protein
MISNLFKTVFIVTCMLVAGTLNAADEVQGLSGSGASFVIKATRDFVGGRIEVYTSGNILIVAREVKKRKVSIDFEKAMTGTYTVRLIKENAQQEFYFLKK